MKIEVFSDTVCPWCYVGVLRLNRALAQRPGLAVELRWLPYELNPDLRSEGEDRAEYMQRRFGDVNRFAGAHARLHELGAELGIDFRFDLQKRMPNTRRSHMLIAWAGLAGADAQTRMKLAILEANFSRGLDIGDTDVLVELAVACGFDGGAARSALDDQGLRSAVEQIETQARQWNISGVPTFIFNRKEAFSGAQEEAVFLECIDRAVA
jgi:predicted DsbA family dithiol-disulfide isomerase